MENVITTNQITIGKINSLLSIGGSNDLFDYSQEIVTVYSGATFIGTRPVFTGCQAIGEYNGIVCESGEIHADVKAALLETHPGCFFVVKGE